jgi:hypothetical protein
MSVKKFLKRSEAEQEFQRMSQQFALRISPCGSFLSSTFLLRKKKGGNSVSCLHLKAFLGIITL